MLAEMRGGRPQKGKGPGPSQPPQQARIGAGPRLLITFVLVEPVLGAREIFWPITEVQIPAPRLGIGGAPLPRRHRPPRGLGIGGLPIRIRRVPGEISLALPWAPIL